MRANTFSRQPRSSERHFFGNSGSKGSKGWICTGEGGSGSSKEAGMGDLCPSCPAIHSEEFRGLGAISPTTPREGRGLQQGRVWRDEGGSYLPGQLFFLQGEHVCEALYSYLQ